MRKGDRVWIVGWVESGYLASRRHSGEKDILGNEYFVTDKMAEHMKGWLRNPDAYKVLVRKTFREPREAIFLGNTTRLMGTSVFNYDEGGYLNPVDSVPVKMVVLATGSRYLKPIAVMEDQILSEERESDVRLA